MADYGVVFDVDGVIADTEALNAEVTGVVLGELFGIEGVRRCDFEKGLGRGAAARVHGVELGGEDVEKATGLRQEYFLRSLREKPLPAFAGVVELIGEGMGDGCTHVAIATSSTLEKSRAVLESAGVPYEQMVYINGNDVTKKKPDPELFILAVAGMGIEAGRCVVIEDAPDGVAAAKAAGCKCIGVTNSVSREQLGQADIVCDSLGEISLERVKCLIDK
jgi:beta-phosphoglucomutase-like phosphatase (HAD superfamily)